MAIKERRRYLAECMAQLGAQALYRNAMHGVRVPVFILPSVSFYLNEKVKLDR